MKTDDNHSNIGLKPNYKFHRKVTNNYIINRMMHRILCWPIYRKIILTEHSEVLVFTDWLHVLFDWIPPFIVWLMHIAVSAEPTTPHIQTIISWIQFGHMPFRRAFVRYRTIDFLIFPVWVGSMHGLGWDRYEHHRSPINKLMPSCSVHCGKKNFVGMNKSWRYLQNRIYINLIGMNNNYIFTMFYSALFIFSTFNWRPASTRSWCCQWRQSWIWKPVPFVCKSNYLLIINTISIVRYIR